GLGGILHLHEAVEAQAQIPDRDHDQAQHGAQHREFDRGNPLFGFGKSFAQHGHAYSTRLATAVPIGRVPEPVQLIFNRALPTKLTLSAMIWVQFVLALLPPAYCRVPWGT